MFDITPFVQAVIAVCLIIGSAYVIPYMKTKISVEEMAQVMGYVTIAVRAAEQIFGCSGMGKEKKAYVLQWLKDHKITVDLDKIDAMIESAVYDLNLEQYSS